MLTVLNQYIWKKSHRGFPCDRNGELLLEEIIVGIGDIKCGRGEQSIATYALGSCVGVCLYDEQTGIGGLLHALLPYSKKTKMVDSARYVDTGVKRL